MFITAIKDFFLINLNYRSVTKIKSKNEILVLDYNFKFKIVL